MKNKILLCIASVFSVAAVVAADESAEIKQNAVQSKTSIVNGKLYKDVDLTSKKSEMQCDFAVGEKIRFSLGVFARKNTEWMVLKNAAETVCQVKMKRDADWDDGTIEFPQNKLIVSLQGKTAGTGEIQFLCGDKYLTLYVTVHQK